MHKTDYSPPLAGLDTVKGYKKMPILPRRWGQSSLEKWHFLADTEPTAVCYSAGPLRQPTSLGSWEAVTLLFPQNGDKLTFTIWEQVLGTSVSPLCWTLCKTTDFITCLPNRRWGLLLMTSSIEWRNSLWPHQDCSLMYWQMRRWLKASFR